MLMVPCALIDLNCPRGGSVTSTAHHANDKVIVGFGLPRLLLILPMGSLLLTHVDSNMCFFDTVPQSSTLLMLEMDAIKLQRSLPLQRIPQPHRTGS